MPIADYDWEGFRALARRLDTLLAGEAELEEDETFAEACRRLLAFVYVAGVRMPSAGDVYEDAGGEEFWESAIQLDGDEEIDPVAVQSEIDALAQALAADIMVLQDDVEPDDYQQLIAAAAFNLRDVCESLSSGMNHFDAGRVNEAAWDWSFGFDEWGAHALAATSALHDLLWGAG